jgi:hypothetical protein
VILGGALGGGTAGGALLHRPTADKIEGTADTLLRKVLKRFKGLDVGEEQGLLGKEEAEVARLSNSFEKDLAQQKKIIGDRSLTVAALQQHRDEFARLSDKQILSAPGAGAHLAPIGGSQHTVYGKGGELADQALTLEEQLDKAKKALGAATAHEKKLAAKAQAAKGVQTGKVEELLKKLAPYTKSKAALKKFGPIAAVGGATGAGAFAGAHLLGGAKKSPLPDIFPKFEETTEQRANRYLNYLKENVTWDKMKDNPYALAGLGVGGVGLGMGLHKLLGGFKKKDPDPFAKPEDQEKATA